jgi:hypothetical protein
MFVKRFVVDMHYFKEKWCHQSLSSGTGSFPEENKTIEV